MATQNATVSDKVFVTEWKRAAKNGTGIKGFEAATGMKAANAQSRAKRYREDGLLAPDGSRVRIPLPELEGGGRGRRANVAELLEILADDED